MKAALDVYNIGYGRDINVELTARQKEWLDASNITSRPEVDKAIKRAKAIYHVTTLEELKQELIRDSSRIKSMD